MLTLVAALAAVVVGGQDEEIVRRRPPEPAALATPSSGQLAAPATARPVTALTETNCMFGGQAVPCPGDAPPEENPASARTLFALPPMEEIFAEETQRRQSAPAAAYAPRDRGCRREEHRSPDGRSVSYQVVCGSDSEAQRSVNEFLNRPR